MFSYISHSISSRSSGSFALGTYCQKVWLFGLAVSNFSLKNVKYLIILSGILLKFVEGKREQRHQQNSSILFLYMSKEDLGLLLERGIVNPTNQEEYIEYMDFKSQCRQDRVAYHRPAQGIVSRPLKQLPQSKSSITIFFFFNQDMFLSLRCSDV